MIRFVLKRGQSAHMKLTDLKSLTLDELWSLHEEIAPVLARKMEAAKKILEHRLQQLHLSTGSSVPETTNGQQSYRRVYPKYRNPAKPAETWAGRGKQPRWLTAQLKLGKKLDDFLI
jgi:DNA-binding protein H-NS